MVAPLWIVAIWARRPPVQEPARPELEHPSTAMHLKLRAKSFISQVYDLLARHNRNASLKDQSNGTSGTPTGTGSLFPSISPLWMFVLL
jgi:hypothetical protein